MIQPNIRTVALIEIRLSSVSISSKIHFATVRGNFIIALKINQVIYLMAILQ